METFRTLARSGYAKATLAVVLFTGMAIWCGALFLKKPDEWPGWVQAVGSVIAIYVAIIVAIYQTATQKREATDAADAELRGMLLSLRAEMSSTLGLLEDRVGPQIRDKPAGHAFNLIYPVPENPFHVYDALLHRLGTIGDDALRTQIVRTYSGAKGFVHTVRFNNDLLRALDLAITTADEGDARAQEVIQGRQAVLATYGDALKAHYEAVMVDAKELQRRLDLV